MAWRGVRSQGRTKWTQQSLTLFSALSAHGAQLLQRSPRRRLVALGEAGRALQADLSLSFLMCRWLYQQPCTASPSKTCSAGALRAVQELCSRQTCAPGLQGPVLVPPGTIQQPCGWQPAAYCSATRKQVQLFRAGQNPGWDKGPALPSSMPAGPLRAWASSTAALLPGSADIPGYPRIIQVPMKYPELRGRGTSETQTCNAPEWGPAGTEQPEPQPGQCRT